MYYRKMFQFGNGQSYNYGCQRFDNFCRYPPPPPFNEHRLTDPHMVFGRPPTNRPPPPFVQPSPFTTPHLAGPAEVSLLRLPPFSRHIPLPPTYPPPPFPRRLPPPDGYHDPSTTARFCGIPSPFSRPPPPPNGQHFRHFQEFSVNRPPPNCRVQNRFPLNCPPPIPPVPNCGYPAAHFNTVECSTMRPSPLNTYRQRFPGSGPSADHCKDLQMKRHLDTGYHRKKVSVMAMCIVQSVSS